jgi:hypothetical protein
LTDRNIASRKDCDFVTKQNCVRAVLPATGTQQEAYIMFKFSSAICHALALTFMVGTVAPAAAVPVVVPNAPIASPDVSNVQLEFRRDREMRRDREVRRDNWRGRDRDRGRDRFERRGQSAYWRGHRGYRDHRPGYRQHNGWWFPPAAFIAGAIIGGAMNQAPAARPGGGSAHVQWCYDRWRSYRASDNSYQPYNGPRRQCVSPYG